jgi:hypothetical protein
LHLRKDKNTPGTTYQVNPRVEPVRPSTVDPPASLLLSHSIRTLTLTLAIPVEMASPPRSPPRSGYLRRSWTMSLATFEAALDGVSIYPCRFEVPRLSCSCASPTAPRLCGFSIDLRRFGIPRRVVLLTALAGGGAWLAPAWPRLDATMISTRYTQLSLSSLLSTPSTLSSGYCSIYGLCFCYLLALICCAGASPKPTAAMPLACL